MDLTPLSSGNAPVLEELYQQYKESPTSVTEEWQRFFQGLENGGFPRLQGGHNVSSNGSVNIDLPDTGDDDKDSGLLHLGITNLQNSYRAFGHLAANLDPLGLSKPDRTVIEKKLMQFSDAELNGVYDSGNSILGHAKLKDIIQWFEETYCSTIGVEHRHLVNEEERLWVQKEVEESFKPNPLSTWEKLRIFDKLVHADYFERFLAKKYVGKKRFSLEGGETLIPLLDTVIEEAGAMNMDGLVLGMAHRGRLNVLVNTLQKPAGLIFAEFAEKYDPDTLDYSDVKYHLGYSNNITTTSQKELHMTLLFNPSHLEAVDPVVVGSVRARQTINQDKSRDKFMGIMIHGDAAFVGQGVVAETLNLMNLEGFTTGGTIHVIVDNQIGFTTLPQESRSTLYATDLAKGFQIPIFHINGDDPEAAFKVAKLAMKYRQKFHKDVIIDLVCYRRHGHNEMDEPAFTQPTIYDVIKKHPRTVQIYEKKLLKDSDIAKEDIEFVKNGATNGLNDSFKTAQEKDTRMEVDTMKGTWAGLSREADENEPVTEMLIDQLGRINEALNRVPENFTPHPKMMKLIEAREKMFQEEIPIDWAFGEAFAIGSILRVGHNVRFCGQDAQRGTFSHRHAVLIDIKNGNKWIPLNSIEEKQGNLEIINSPLSEFSVLCYEYGYSLSDPHSLVVWEAQFGDFANGAQIIFDQFLTCSEVKWHRYSGLVVLLPHGYEGQGPEHSSARLERFLQNCARNNIQVCNPTTPAQIFHLLRRQILRKYRKPLIVMTPKSLLRKPEATSKLSELSSGIFEEILPDTTVDKSKVERLVLCCGKVYYDLEAKRNEKKLNVAIARVEQLYPYHEEKISKEINSYPNLKELVWAQEEPLNMGAWLFVEDRLREQIKSSVKLMHAARTVSASPAAGLAKLHQAEQEALVDEALGISKG